MSANWELENEAHVLRRLSRKTHEKADPGGQADAAKDAG